MIGLLAGCGGACGGGGGGGSGGSDLAAGEEVPKPGGGTFFLDSNQGGTATRLKLAEMFWGRLVDVHDVEPDGTLDLTPVFADMVVSENVISDGQNYLLETNAITQTTRLVIRRTKGAPDTGAGTFDELLRAAMANLPAVIPRNDDGTSPEPFSMVPRNATIVLRFDDLLADGPSEAARLGHTVLVKTGYSPSLPFATRIEFDPNHGAIAGGVFHSTRLLIDTTVTEAESADLAFPLPINALGLPESSRESGQPNVSLRIPSRIDSGSGQFFLLTNLTGSSLADTDNGPVDSSAPTRDVVRAFRSGNGLDLNNGFLIDPFTPRIVGSWGLVIETAQDPAGVGTEFVLGVRFSTPCRRAPRAGDVVRLGQRYLEVAAGGTAPDANGVVDGLRVRLLAGLPVANANSLLGGGAFLTTLDQSPSVEFGCWANFLPEPGTPPVQDLRTDSQILVRFSEPMNPESVRPFDTFRVVRGVLGVEALATNLVVGEVLGSLDLREFTFSPSLPLSNQGGLAYSFQLVAGPDGVTDLAGNGLADALPAFEFSLDSNQPPEMNGGVAMRFVSVDELEPFGAADLRGQAMFDEEREIIKPRPVAFASVPADRSTPTVGNMTRFPPGLQTPLSPLGSKMQSVWRYADVGWSVRDESKFNMDVIGMSWAPVGGQVLSDFYPEFEILLAHSRKLPDETFTSRPLYPESGLGRSGGTNCISPQENIAYSENVLDDPLGPQTVVHSRIRGYRIDPANLTLSGSGTLMMPYPMNQATELADAITYTWRDTAVLKKDGRGGAGIPMDIEVGPPLGLEPEVAAVARAGSVPSIGLPLLWEIRCYPSDGALGLNAHDVSLAISNFCVPNFRAFSTGGIDETGNRVAKNPDLEVFPSGGFNARSSPPGLPTLLDSDNTYYIGQLDFVIRISRAHTMWLDTGFAHPVFVNPVVEPDSLQQPEGTRILAEYRGADTFLGVGQDPFDALALDFYGDLPDGATVYHDGEPTWTEDVGEISGARYIQVRLSFFNNIASRESPILDSLGLAWETL